MALDRRNFIRLSGMGLAPALLPSHSTQAGVAVFPQEDPSEKIVKFFFDGEFFGVGDYLAELETLMKNHPVEPDRYGQGGVVEELEKKFAELTGKEKAIYMPSGTLANQLAISVLSGDRTKVFVQDTSHVYRDEADAAQSVFNKRLMPLAPGATYFTAAELKAAIEDLGEREVFASGVGCISIENPVRRTDGRMVPLEEIRNISAYCREKGYKLHLDGARIFMTSAWSGFSVKEYASFFDTVYISLYKYLGATGGAVLCGDAGIIDKMPHLIKIHGASMYRNWPGAAMALHRLAGVEERLQEAIRRSKIIFTGLNKLKGINVSGLDGGTNIYKMTFPAGTERQKFMNALRKKNIWMPGPNEKGKAMITVNETLLYQEPDVIVRSVKEALSA